MKPSIVSTLTVQHPKLPGIHSHPVLEICLFSDRPRGDIAEQVGTTMLEFSREYGRQFSCYKTNTMSKSASLDVAVLAKIDGLVHDADFKNLGLLGLEMFSGDVGAAYMPPSILFFSSGLEDEDGELVWSSFIRFCTPADDNLNGRALMEQISRILAAGSWYCGHAGLSMYWNIGDTTMERELGRRVGLLLRHPGVGYHDPLSFRPFIGLGLIQVGWITIVGASLCKQLGGVPTARDFEGTDVKVMSLGTGGGVAFVAGQVPILGSNDPAMQAELAPYRAVGRSLAAIRLPDDQIELLNLAGMDDEDIVRKWYLRFFGE